MVPALCKRPKEGSKQQLDAAMSFMNCNDFAGQAP